jgi:alpha-galactosidase
MKRRHFLKLSGLSTAALFFNNTYATTGAPTETLQFPTSISTWQQGKWTPLTGSRENWQLNDLTVRLKHTKTGISIQLQSPHTAIEKLRFSWDLPTTPSSIWLGDAWERSYGDLSWQNIQNIQTTFPAPWYLLINDGTNTRAFGVKTGAKCFCSWDASAKNLNLYLDTMSGGAGVELGDRTLHAAEIVTTLSNAKESPFQTATRFCRLMCENPRLPKKPVYGINDWYFAYGNNSKKLILDSTQAMAELAPISDNLPFSVVDDGWEGIDFQTPNDKFGDMSIVAAEIKKLGMKPGLWTRPLLANNKAKATELIPLRTGESGDRYYDPTLPETLQRIDATFRLYKDWGFDLVKHDYTTYDFFGRWGFEMREGMTAPGWHFHDRSHTNAEILLKLYNTIRQAAGDLYLIGCNTVSHLSAGIFELNRIGDDTSGKEWARTLKMGVNTMGFRLPQHKTFYAVDGDCVGLTTQIPWEKNKQWLQLLAESGAPLFISAQPEATGPEQKAYIKTCFAMAAKDQPTGEPLDWTTNPRPAKWRLNGREVDFSW